MTDQSIYQDEEIWKPVFGYEGYYEVSNTGKIRSLERYVITNQGYKTKVNSRIMTQQKNKYGYNDVKLSKNGKALRLLTHRIVMQSFIGKSDLQVDHLNKDKQDNRVTNLEYVSHRENVRRSSVCKNGNPGIYWSKRNNMWACAIQKNKKRHFGGYFRNQGDAIKARDDLLKKLSIKWDGKKYD